MTVRRMKMMSYHCPQDLRDAVNRRADKQHRSRAETMRLMMRNSLRRELNELKDEEDEAMQQVRDDQAVPRLLAEPTPE
jgi:hypothetical protein